QIPEDIKKERLSRLMALQNQISLEKNQAELGKVVEVLIEGESKNNPETLMGRDRRNKLVIIPKKDGLIGEIVNVRINKVQSFTLYGEVV
ncbi:MAG: TRAM domain-containing protein, partial [Halanaerobiales bacterium]